MDIDIMFNENVMQKKRLEFGLSFLVSNISWRNGDTLSPGKCD